MTNKFTIAVMIAFCAYACKKTDQTATTTPAAAKIAPDGFTFLTTKQVSVSVKLLAPDNTPIAGVPVSLYRNITVNDNGNVDNKTAIFTGISDASGNVTGTVTVPANMDTVLIDPNYTGIIHNAKAFISSGAITAILGGPTGIGGNVVVNQIRPSTNPQTNTNPLRTNGTTTGTLGINYVSMGLADLLGRPTYLASPSDVISSTLISWLNTSLPESKPLTITHPQYLSGSATGTINMVATGDVSITFVTEGAGYYNSIGYYTYPTNNPPATTSDISTINIILPNASLHGSGGNMYAGDKVKLGTFSAGTSIGFVLFANAWTASSVINTSAQKFFSDTKLNPEVADSLKRHSVLLNDVADNLYLVGFEDQLRSGSGSDNDFNDVVFYATSNPASAISSTNVAPIDKPQDTDGDGVTDVFDQYPTDATRAYNNYYPSQNSFATLAFEDLWPSTGDYDMNDLVVGYRYNYVSNAKNQIVELYGDFAVQAAGASFQNGFGVQFPFTAASVKQVTGQKLISNYVKLASNGVEASQTKAVIIPFDNHQALINNPAGAYFINTKNTMAKVIGDTAHVYMQFVSPLTATTFGSAPFNPFLISNMRRSYEIHLSGNAPTDLADAKLLGTGDDVSNAASGIYYMSKSNWPWALSFPSTFVYPTEGTNISGGYLHFLDWAKSGGMLYTDWYTNTGVDYRNTTNLYTK